ncbi:Hypothetical protein NGAL_HAMBI490_60440 [Neorhizobium galegae bv. officinalis]|nr:Hypothetical protein NGAL_HAMBI490_60440 [Neorhizobium galegae bv. officinalis]
MFEAGTVFVVGAGASAEFGLPVGWALVEQIREKSKFNFDHGSYPKGNRKIFETVFSKYGKEQKQLEQAFMAFADIQQGVETAGSIDEYINRYSDDSLIAELGKLLIAHSILEAENKSKLMPAKGQEAEGINWNSVQDTWISPFARTLFDGIKANDVESIGNGIKIICFNYDRCIEHYLEYAIMRAYRGVERKQARQIVDNMQILHPYGSLGTLNNFSFGTPIEHTNLYNVTKNLITWSETISDETLPDAMRQAVLDARTIVFLGFAFANQNLKLLKPEMATSKPYFTNVYATAFGLTNDVEESLRRKIGRLVTPRDYLISDPQERAIKFKYGMKCREFMDTQMLNIAV